MRKLFLLFSLVLVFLTGIFLKASFAEGNEWQRIRPSTLASTVAGEDAVTQTNAAIPMAYYLSPGDIIEVFVWQNPDLSKEVIVGPDGMISYPLVGRVKAIGLTLDKLEDKFTTEFAKYIKFPQVSIMIKKFSGNKIIVLGEVLYPGIYSYQGAINLIEAVALAGDFTQNAHIDSVLIVRGGFSGKPSVERINMARVITRGIMDGKDINLKPNDVVYVPRTFVANLNKFMSTDIGPIITNAQNTLDVRTRFRTSTGHRY